MNEIEPRAVVSLDENEMLSWWCPGCENTHIVPVEGPKSWTWNKSIAKPTLTPSIALTWGDERRCHLFIRDGLLMFCRDSTHELAGLTTPMTPL